MRNTRVFKIGGSVLREPADFPKIVKKITKGKIQKICIVTSAMKGKTSELIKTFLKAVPQPGFWDFEQFAGLGEIQSTLLFESTFNSLGIKAKAILPWMREWPLFISLKDTKSLSPDKINEKRDFHILDRSIKRIRQYIIPMFKRYQILIIPGFIAKDSRNRVVTLGRGGSDISALLLSELLKAKELVLIKEVNGVMNLDPNLHPRATKIKTLDAGKLGLIASSGAQVLHPVSLKHRQNLKKIRVTSAEADIHEETGTEISFEKRISVISSPIIYSVLTFVGDRIPETPGLLSTISTVLARNEISIYSITISENLIALYVEKGKGELAYKLLSPILNKLENLKFLSLKKDISKVLVRSLKFINEPGIIKKIVTPISKQGINIWEVLTAHTDVMVFVEHNDLNKTYNIIRQLFTKKHSKR